jgi:hypothetical protein
MSSITQFDAGACLCKLPGYPGRAEKVRDAVWKGTPVLKTGLERGYVKESNRLS